jgi:subtilisin family serine protease
VEGISFIKLPDKPHPDFIQSQGVGLTGASSYHSAGYTGSGVKVAIIDGGFAGLSSAIAAGELPSTAIKIDCTGTACVSTTFPSETNIHGTAVGEIAHDMAPGAQLYLIKIADSLDLVDAKNYCVTNGIDIINHSMCYFNLNFYDGQCYYSNPVCTADNAYANGILWVNSAGNYAQSHYEATFTDSNADKLHDTLISFAANAGDSFRAYLTWNAWPATDQDYDFLLLDSSFNIVAKNNDPQTGAQPPVEKISCEIPKTGTYLLVIYKYSASANHRLEVYSPNYYLNPAVASSSLGGPADASGALAVAAISYSNWTSGPQESFSSQGPTNDGRIKPDISGPDFVSTYTYGASAFPGTSASAPHVAGAAALILGANPTYSVAQLWNALTGSAIDMGSGGKDNIYGFGRLNLPIGAPDFDTTGVFRPSNGAIYLKYSNSPGFADVVLTYGLPGDKPIAGDWDGDGVSTIGVYRDGVFLLRNSNTNGFADIAFSFGEPGDLPVAGDWNGDGIDTIGIYRDGLFMLRNSNSTGPPEMEFALGVSGDVPIAGDWTGKGYDTAGVFRPSNGALYLKNTNETGYADIMLTYGLPGDKPVVGDWDGDGIDTIGVYRNGTFMLRNSNTNGFADIVFALGIAGDEPISGYWGR